MRVLGLDPSSQSTGFGIIDFSGDQYNVLTFGTIKPGRRLLFHQKLGKIKQAIENLIAEYAPEEVAIENPFYAQNIKTAIALGQVRGATLVAIAGCGSSLFEYSALEIKMAVTGYGRADKSQVNLMVKTLLRLEGKDLEEDASDALACAFCHLNTRLSQKNIEESKI